MTAEDRTMKPLLGKLVEEAVHLAIIDSCLPPQDKNHPLGLWSDEEKAAMLADIYAIPASALASMDPMALAQNVCVRLLGPGGWLIGGHYAGNATARELFDVTFERPDRSHVSELAFDLLRGMEERSHLSTPGEPPYEWPDGEGQ